MLYSPMFETNYPKVSFELVYSNNTHNQTSYFRTNGMPPKIPGVCRTFLFSDKTVDQLKSIRVCLTALLRDRMLMQSRRSEEFEMGSICRKY